MKVPSDLRRRHGVDIHTLNSKADASEDGKGLDKYCIPNRRRLKRAERSIRCILGVIFAASMKCVSENVVFGLKDKMYKMHKPDGNGLPTGGASLFHVTRNREPECAAIGNQLKQWRLVGRGSYPRCEGW